MKILLVGSGPASFSVALRLLDSDNSFEIDLVDGNTIEAFNPDDGSSNCMYSKDALNSDRLKKLSSQYLDSNFNNEENKMLPLPSKIFGGYSNVWGGAVEILDKKYHHLWMEEIDNLLQSFDAIGSKINLHSSSSDNPAKHHIISELPISNREKQILKSLGRLGDSFEIDNSTVAFNYKITSEICDFCHEFKWSCDKDIAWSPKSFFKENIENGRINYLKNTSVFRLSNNAKNEIEVFFDADFENSTPKIYDKVFLAAGAIGTSKIILRSVDNINMLEILTTDLVTIPYITNKMTSEKKHTFVDIYIKYFRKSLFTFGQLYGFSNNLLSLSKEAVPVAQKFGSFLKFIFKRTGGIFIYLDQKISSSLYVTTKGTEISIEPGRKNNITKSIFIILQICIQLLFRGLLLVPFIGSWRKHGNSNHYGSQLPMNLDTNKRLKNETDSLGSISTLKNLHIVDSSVLPIVPSGPITFITMANSYRITNEVLLKIKGSK